MLFRELNHASCKTYLIACDDTHGAALIDPLKEKIDRYLSILAYLGCRLEFIIDTHTHADHRTGAFELGDLTGAPVVMHRRAPQPHVALHVDDGQRLAVGHLELRMLYTPGHSPDAISVHALDRVFTGDCLLIHSAGRVDFPGGDAGAEYDSITQKLFALPDDTMVFPGHDYRGHTNSTIGEEKHSNPRIVGRSRDAYIELMNNLGMPLPDRIQEVLQPNQAALDDARMQFPALARLHEVRQWSARELFARISAANPPVLLDVREPDELCGELGHIAGCLPIPLRDLSDRVGELSSVKSRDIVAICRAGVRSTTAAAILTGLGFDHVWNLKGGMLDWNDAGLPVER